MYRHCFHKTNKQHVPFKDKVENDERCEGNREARGRRRRDSPKHAKWSEMGGLGSYCLPGGWTRRLLIWFFGALCLRMLLRKRGGRLLLLLIWRPQLCSWSMEGTWHQGWSAAGHWNKLSWSARDTHQRRPRVVWGMGRKKSRGKPEPSVGSQTKFLGKLGTFRHDVAKHESGNGRPVFSACFHHLSAVC